jgi:hypothetical protein
MECVVDELRSAGVATDVRQIEAGAEDRDGKEGVEVVTHGANSKIGCQCVGVWPSHFMSGE